MAERGSAGQTRASVPTQPTQVKNRVQADSRARAPAPHNPIHTIDSLFQPLIYPVVHGLVPQMAVLRLQHPVAFIREIQHL